MNKIYFIVGSPASGKSTAGRFLAQKLREKGQQVIHINDAHLVEACVHIYDPELNHVSQAKDGTYVFKDSFMLEKMNEFIFGFIVNIYPNALYIIEMGRGNDETSIASTYKKTFTSIPEEKLKTLKVIHILAADKIRKHREAERIKHGEQYCPNIDEYDTNDLNDIKKDYPHLDFVTIVNEGSLENYHQALTKVI